MMVQSSKPKFEKSGWPPPTSKTSSTPKTSSWSKSTAGSSSFSSFSFSSFSSVSFFSSSFFSSSFSSSFFSSSFFAASSALSSFPSSFSFSAFSAFSFSALSFSSLSFSAFAFSSAAFLSASAFFLAASTSFCATAVLCWFCLACQACIVFCQSFHFPVNHSPGCSSSMRVETFRSRTHCFRYSLHLSPLLHSCRTSSKPSSFSGSENFTNDAFSVCALRSGVGSLRNQVLFSSPVSSAFGGSPSGSSGSSADFSSSSSGSSSFFSSGAGSPAFAAASASALRLSCSCLRFAARSAFFRSRSSCLCRFSRIFLFFSSACFVCHSAVTVSCLACSIISWHRFFSGCGGSPTSTAAVRLKPEPAQRAAASFRSSLRRLDLTSMTT
mmetsp:Transcript_83855/g.245857  ORF Transcript_83855/g.245857 Transcript_83855/m.245857 type:complete len:383 (+) Transcript_83855:421-1569(+)